jgi:hypothetical protein
VNAGLAARAVDLLADCQAQLGLKKSQQLLEQCNA